MRTITSSLIKTHLLAYFRFDRQTPYIATECGYFNGDVVVSDSSTVIEVEVKISWADFLNEFTVGKKNRRGRKCRKERKHELYLSGSSTKGYAIVPNKFYFAVPKKLVKRVVDYLNSINSPYGVIGVLNKKSSPYQKSEAVRIFRRAKILNTSKPTPNTIKIIVQRMGSELITLRQIKL